MDCVIWAQWPAGRTGWMRERPRGDGAGVTAGPDAAHYRAQMLVVIASALPGAERQVGRFWLARRRPRAASSGASRPEMERARPGSRPLSGDTVGMRSAHGDRSRRLELHADERPPDARCASHLANVAERPVRSRGQGVEWHRAGRGAQRPARARIEVRGDGRLASEEHGGKGRSNLGGLVLLDRRCGSALNRTDFGGDSILWRKMESWQSAAAAPTPPNGGTRRS